MSLQLTIILGISLQLVSLHSQAFTACSVCLFQSCHEVHRICLLQARKVLAPWNWTREKLYQSVSVWLSGRCIKGTSYPTHQAFSFTLLKIKAFQFTMMKIKNSVLLLLPSVWLEHLTFLLGQYSVKRPSIVCLHFFFSKRMCTPVPLCLGI